jgi:hypothetical protein
MRRKLLVLAGLGAMLVALWNQPVRAGCTWGTTTFWVCGNWCYAHSDTGCIYDGEPPDPVGTYYCTAYVAGQCAAGYYNYPCGCS